MARAGSFGISLGRRAGSGHRKLHHAADPGTGAALIPDIRFWILGKPEKVQLLVWQRLTEFLTSAELEAIMVRVRQRPPGAFPLFQAHDELGLFEKYRFELAKIREVIERDGTEAFR